MKTDATIPGYREAHRLEILLVDDEPDITLTVGAALTDAGHGVTTATDGQEALTALTLRAFDVLICDVRLPKIDGLTLFRRARRDSPDTTVILITAFAAVEDAVAAVKEGAYDYLTKPFDIDELAVRLQRIAHHRALVHELEDARAQLATTDLQEAQEPIVGRCAAMLRLINRVDTIATCDAPVLLTGERGTGKRLLARTLHDRGPRRDRPLVVVECAAFPDTLLEAELFGDQRDASASAAPRRDGRFRAAHTGTLVLDEVGEMSLPAQAKLSRLLHEGTFEPPGGAESPRVDVRVITTTSRDGRDLKDRVARGQFRADLYDRLNVITVDIPPLRERKGDLPLLVQSFLKKLTAPRKAPATLSVAAWAALAAFPFPGNVRQLGHAVQQAAALVGDDDEIQLQHLPRDLGGDSACSADIADIRRRPLNAVVPRPLGAALKEFERDYLQRALAQASGKRTLAAEILGISRKNLWEKLRAHRPGRP